VVTSFNVLVQIGLLGEARSTVFGDGVRTTVWALASVRPQVVQEVVTLAEPAPTRPKVALEDLFRSPRSRIAILEDPEALR
jgi:hypothetical protein